MAPVFSQQYVDKKPVFTLATRLVSSIHSQHPRLAAFFHAYDSNGEVPYFLDVQLPSAHLQPVCSLVPPGYRWAKTIVHPRYRRVLWCASRLSLCSHAGSASRTSSACFSFCDPRCSLVCHLLLFDVPLIQHTSVDWAPKEGHAPHHPQLVSYIEYFFDNPSFGKDALYEKVVKLWLITLFVRFLRL